MGFEDEVEQSIGRPCRQTNGRSKRTCDLTSSIVPRGTSFHRLVESSVLLSDLILHGSSCCRRSRSTARSSAARSLLTRRPRSRRHRSGLDLSSGARAGLTAFLAGIARSVAQHNVTINFMLPGPFDTDRLRSNHEVTAKKQGITVDQGAGASGHHHSGAAAWQRRRIRGDLRVSVLGPRRLHHRAEHPARRRYLSRRVLALDFWGRTALARVPWPKHDTRPIPSTHANSAVERIAHEARPLRPGRP